MAIEKNSGKVVCKRISYALAQLGIDTAENGPPKSLKNASAHLLKSPLVIRRARGIRSRTLPRLTDPHAAKARVATTKLQRKNCLPMQWTKADRNVFINFFMKG